MHRVFFLIFLLSLAGCKDPEVVDKEPDVSFSLGDWGPYTEHCAGVQHIADKARGLRFDLSVFPVTPGKQNLSLENGGHLNVFTSVPHGKERMSLLKRLRKGPFMCGSPAKRRLGSWSSGVHCDLVR